MTRKLIVTAMVVVLVAGLGPTALSQEVTPAAPSQEKTTTVPAQESKLQTTAGTMQVGGLLTFVFQDVIPSQGNSTTGYLIALIPSFGYFVINGLEVTANFSFATAGGDLYSGSPKLVGFGIGARYVLNLGVLDPYFGVSLGMNFAIPDHGDTTKYFDVSGLLGVLIPLNQHVAVNLGISLIGEIDLASNYQVNEFLLPVSVGIEGFF
jgi:hypothetical protein